MAIHVVNHYDPRARNERYRFGTVRYNPRGVPRGDRPYDVWLPELAPSAKLLRRFKGGEMAWDVFARRYRSEMNKPTPRHLIALLVVLSGTPTCRSVAPAATSRGAIGRSCAICWRMPARRWAERTALSCPTLAPTWAGRPVPAGARSRAAYRRAVGGQAP